MKIFIKIFGLAIIFAIIFNFANAFLNWNKIETLPSTTQEWNRNIYKFKKSNQVFLSKVWVALTTNIWTKHKQREKLNLYKDVPYIAKTISEKKYVDNKNLSLNLIKIHEYYNVLTTNIKNMIDSSYDKRETLDAYIEQLKYRYKDASFRIKVLSKKQSQLSADLKSSSEKINLLRKKITLDFNKFYSQDLEKDTDKLLIEKAKYNYARTYLIFTNQYIKQYQKLNNWAKNLIKVLTLNKEAILKNTKVIIPKTWIKTLRNLDLIENEKIK